MVVSMEAVTYPKYWKDKSTSPSPVKKKCLTDILHKDGPQHRTNSRAGSKPEYPTPKQSLPMFPLPPLEVLKTNIENHGEGPNAIEVATDVENKDAENATRPKPQSTGAVAINCQEAHDEIVERKASSWYITSTSF